jgi:hypothetical protein
VRQQSGWQRAGSPTPCGGFESVSSRSVRFTIRLHHNRPGNNNGDISWSAFVTAADADIAVTEHPANEWRSARADAWKAEPDRHSHQTGNYDVYVQRSIDGEHPVVGRQLPVATMKTSEAYANVLVDDENAWLPTMPPAQLGQRLSQRPIDEGRRIRSRYALAQTRAAWLEHDDGRLTAPPRPRFCRLKPSLPSTAFRLRQVFAAPA